jgi:hypothetical protein
MTQKIVTDLLSRGKIDDALTQLSLFIKDDEDLLKELLLLQSRSATNLRNMNLNKITQGEYSNENTKITSAIQSLINDFNQSHTVVEYAKKEKKQPNTKIYDIEILDINLAKALDIYIDRGEFHSAKIMLINRYGSFLDLPLDFKLKIIEINQKYGQLKEAREQIDYILEHLSEVKNTVKAFKIQIMDFRLASQEHRTNWLIDNYKNLIQIADDLGEPAFKCTLLNRVGVAFAAEEHYQQSQIIFDKSKENATELGLDHSFITADCLHAMCALLKHTPISKNPLETLIQAQTEYLEKETNRYIWQGNAFKSTIQCLFSEAAYYLLIGQQSKGVYRLCIANQFVTLCKANSTSEGYSELVVLLKNTPKIQKKVELAMNGYNNENNFLSSIETIGELLIDTSPIFEAVSIAPNSLSWEKVRNQISKYDKRQLG